MRLKIKFKAKKNKNKKKKKQPITYTNIRQYTASIQKKRKKDNDYN